MRPFSKPVGSVFEIFSRLVRLIWRRRSGIVLIGGCLIVLARDGLDPGSLYNQVTAQARDVSFDVVDWESQAIREVLGQQLNGTLAALNDDQRSAAVVAYLDDVHRFQDLQSQISGIYANPKISDPLQAAAKLINQRDDLQVTVRREAPLAEAIVVSQVSAVLTSEGFTSLNQVWPPVAAKFTDMPDYLVISPRDRINFDLGLLVNPLSADQADTLENQIAHNLNVSALVTPLGGLSLYPSMVAQTWYAPALFADVAHEWCHLYLALYPLGWNYDQPETRIINESTAQRFGDEIGRETIDRFYQKYPAILKELPLIAPPLSPAASLPAKAALPSDDQAPFDYGTEMNQIRITVDYYLWLGQVDQAEAYMDAMRNVFAAHHYAIRKLNQAYFAFYGGYQSGSAGGAGGTDPTGEAIAGLRSRAPSVLGWLNQLRWITTRQELLQTVNSG